MVHISDAIGKGSTNREQHSCCPNKQASHQNSERMVQRRSFLAQSRLKV